ncbi:E2/UBC family protein [Methylobacterium radiotolerans]
MNAILERQLVQLRERFGAVDATRLGSGTVLVTVSSVPLPTGWSAATTDIRFLVPTGYPFAALDCFWADAGLTLAGGGAPHASQQNPIPEVGQPGRWFSWHLASPWDANRDTLSSWMNVILDRLRQPR